MKPSASWWLDAPRTAFTARGTAFVGAPRDTTYPPTTERVAVRQQRAQTRSASNTMARAGIRRHGFGITDDLHRGDPHD